MPYQIPVANAAAAMQLRDATTVAAVALERPRGLLFMCVRGVEMHIWYVDETSENGRARDWGSSGEWKDAFISQYI